MILKFSNREEAGRALAKKLHHYAGAKDAIVLALPRGGVPVAHAVAQALSLPMDIWLVRKLGVPGHEELAMGAIAAGGTIYLNPDVVGPLQITRSRLNDVILKEEAELERRRRQYRGNRPIPHVKGQNVIVVDDGLATGATMRAAVESLRQAGAAKIVVSVPVGSMSACADLESVADEVACVFVSEIFYGVGQWYDDFSQTSDEEVQNILDQYLEPETPRRTGAQR